MDITVKAKVLWLREDDMETMAEDYDPEFAPKDKFVWGQLTLSVKDILFYWGQSKTRSVIECKNGRLILVNEAHETLRERITAIRDEMRQEQLDAAWSDEEDLILGEEEPEDSSNDGN